MKTYKQNVLDELNRRAVEVREINLKEAALSVGVTRLSGFECREIADRFIKMNPTYRLVNFYDPADFKNGAPSNLSVWEHGVLTELEYEEN